MDEPDANRPVACTLTAEQEAERPERVRTILRDTYTGADELESGYTIRFEGTNESLVAVATFVSNELHCCAFADYQVAVSPPYDETTLTITGPEGTKGVFAQFVDRLEQEK